MSTKPGQALQPMIDNSLPFEYTLNGIDPSKIDNEVEAIKAIWSGVDDTGIVSALDDPKATKLPGRMKELQELYEAGYQLSFDATTNSYVFIKP